MARTILAALAFAGALAFGAAHAAAPDVAAALQRYCVAAAGDPAKTMAAADADGWDKSPPASPLVSKLPSFLQANTRERSTGDVQMLLAAGAGQMNNQGSDLTMQTCTLAVSPADPAAVAASIQALTGIPPTPNASKSGFDFAYSDGPDGKKDITAAGDDEAKAMVRSGVVRLIYVAGGGGGVLVSYIIPRM